VLPQQQLDPRLKDVATEVGLLPTTGVEGLKGNEGEIERERNRIRR
jgi:hypothetical protein